MAIGVLDALSYATTHGLGTTLSGPASTNAFGLAQRVREFAAQQAAEIEALATQSHEITVQLGTSTDVNWHGVAANQFQNQVAGEQDKQIHFTEQLKLAASQTIRAGENLAAQIDQLAGAIASAGTLVDRAITTVAELHEDFNDIFDVVNHSSVTSAQWNLQNLLNDSLLTTVQNALAKGGL